MNIRRILKEELYKQYNINRVIKKNLYETIDRFILNESLTSIVYHFRGMDGLLNILETNQFKLSKAMRRDFELNNGYKYFISFTRSKKTNYTDISTRTFVSRFWIDGNKLNHKYKSSPVNYFNDEDYKDVEYTSNLGLYNESEDRLLSNKPTIDNFLQYVIRIDINIGEYNFLDKVKSICDEECMKHIYVYVNTDDFYLGNNKCYNLYENYSKLIDFKPNIENESNDDKISNDNFQYDGKIKGVPNMVAVINDDDETNIYNTKENRLISDIWFDDVNDFYHGASIVIKNRKYNFIFPNGKLVSNTWFDYVDYFEEDGYSKVMLNNKFNLLKLNGKIKFNNWYDDILYHNRNLCIVKNSDKYDIINDKGNILIDKCDYIKIIDNTIMIFKDNKILFIDKYGYIIKDKILSDVWFDDYGDFYNGISIVEINGKYNLMDVNGKLYLNKWAENESLSLNDDGTYIAKIDGKYNLYRLNGQKIFNNDFEEILFHDNHSSGVRINGKIYIVDDRGNKLIDDTFDNAEYYKSMYIVYKGYKSTYLNKNCEYITNLWFDKCNLFDVDYPKHAYVELNNRYNIINRKGDLICDIWFDDINPFSLNNALYDYAIVTLDKKINYINRKGKLISNHWFDEGRQRINKEGYFNVDEEINNSIELSYALYPDGRLFIKQYNNGNMELVEVENSKDFDAKKWYIDKTNKMKNNNK